MGVTGIGLRKKDTMEEIKYSTVPGKIKTLFKKIRTTGVPPTVDKKWLGSIGLTKSSDASLLSILKFLKFVDDSGKPMEIWNECRSSNKSKSVIGKVVRKAYSGLFNTYPNAHVQSEEDVKNYMLSRTGKSERVIELMYQTFSNLCSLGDFTGRPEPKKGDETEKPKEEPEQTSDEMDIEKIYKGFGEPVTININIQLTLPETKDIEVYNKFFESLQKYLIKDNE